MNDGKQTDQAEQLRKMVDNREDYVNNATELPPRSEVHRKNNKNTKVKFKIRFPLVRLLLILFLIIVILAVTSPIWLEKFV